MKGVTSFNSQTIELLRLLVKTYSQANSAADQKMVRGKMRKLGFYVSDYGIQNITPSIFEGLLNKAHIRCTDNSFQKGTITTQKEIEPLKKNVIQKKVPAVKPLIVNNDHLEMELINGTFKKAGLIDALVPKKTGFYCIKLANGSQLPKPYQDHLNNRPHSIIYVGKAEGQTLKKRFLGQELRAKGHGTFFRSIGAVLGYLPKKGILIAAKNKNNYTFQPADEAKIIAWINTSLEVNWVVYEGDFSIEKQWISKYCPLLNDSHNPLRLNELKADKAKCRNIAFSSTN